MADSQKRNRNAIMPGHLSCHSIYNVYYSLNVHYESNFEYVHTPQRMRWRKNGTKYDIANLRGTVKNSRKHVMMWGSFCTGGMGQLHHIPGVINGRG